jgi:hypothetical protein
MMMLTDCDVNVQYAPPLVHQFFKEQITPTQYSLTLCSYLQLVALKLINNIQNRKTYPNHILRELMTSSLFASNFHGLKNYQYAIMTSSIDGWRTDFFFPTTNLSSELESCIHSLLKVLHGCPLAISKNWVPDVTCHKPATPTILLSL